jgi:hypothetical protein
MFIWLEGHVDSIQDFNYTMKKWVRLNFWYLLHKMPCGLGSEITEKARNVLFGDCRALSGYWFVE